MDKRPVSPSSLPADERRLRSQLHHLLTHADGMLHGSLIAVARRCGKSYCRCATDDKARHPALCLGQTRKGKTTMVHIPKRLEPMVRQWVANYQQAADLLEQLNQQGRERLARAKASKPLSKAAASPKAAASQARSSRRATPKAKPPRKPS